MKKEETHTENTIKSESGLPKSTKPKLIYWLLGVLLTLIALVLGFAQLTGYVAARLIKSQVEDHSNHVYTVDFDDLRINWQDSQIELSEFKYRKIDANAVVDRELDFSSHKAQIKLESITGIYFQKALHVEKFILNKPKVLVNQLVKREKKQNFSFKTGNLFKLVQGFVKSFQIDDFQVDHLYFDYIQSYDELPQHYIVNDLSFHIHNFHLDSTSVAEDKEFFFTEYVDVTLRNQAINVGDGIHQITIDSFCLSTQTNNIEAFNISIGPMLNAAITPDSIYNRYQVKIPYSGIKGLNFLKAYAENVLEVDSILFNDAVVKSSLSSVRKKSGAVAIDSTIENGVLHLLLSVFDRYELRQFEINNTEVEVVLDNRMDTSVIEGLNLEFTKYVLDSSALEGEMYYPNFEGLKIKGSRTQFRIAEW